MFTKSLYQILLIVLIAGVNACSDIKGNNQKEKKDIPVAVTLSTVTEGIQPVILASGEVEAVHTADLSIRMMGRITNIYVKVGDGVRKGQLLASVWDEEVKAKRAQTDAAIAEAEVAFASTQKDYDRFNNLYKQQSATAKELDNVTLQYQSAKARVTAARQMRSEVNAALSYSRLTAPFDGVVTRKSGEVGNLASPGMPILTIQHSGTFQVTASVAENDIAKIRLGGEAHVQLKSSMKSFKGKIIQISPSSQFTGGQYIIKISIPETGKKDIYAGMFAGISIPVADAGQIQDHAALIPAAAIVKRGELTGIYTVGANSSALLRWIRLGKTYGDRVEVTSGISVGEQFIRLSSGRLYNGVPVIVQDFPVTTLATIDSQ